MASMHVAKISLFFLGFNIFNSLFAQSINPNYVYWMDSDEIYEYNPSSRDYKSFNLKCPAGSSGLAIGPSRTENDSFTFYTTVDRYLYCWQNKKWKNTNINVQSVNIAIGNKYIFILDGINSTIYRSDFLGQAVPLVDFKKTFYGPYDLICDLEDNFYILHNKRKIFAKYNQDGQLTGEIKVSGLNDQSSGGGIAIVENIIYANVSGSSVRGKQTQEGIITFENDKSMASSMNDFASIPTTYNFKFSEPIDNDTRPSNIMLKTDTSYKRHQNIIIDSLVKDSMIIMDTSNYYNHLPIVDTLVKGSNLVDDLKPVSLTGVSVNILDSVSIPGQNFLCKIGTEQSALKANVKLSLNGKEIFDGEIKENTMVVGKIRELVGGANYLVFDLVRTNQVEGIVINGTIIVGKEEKSFKIKSNFNSSGVVKIIYQP